MRCDAIDPISLAPRLPTPSIGTRGEWLTAGATNAMFADGRLFQLVRGLWTTATNLENPRELLELLRPFVPPDSSLGGWAAALVHGVRDSGPMMRSMRPEPVLLCQPRAQHRAPSGRQTMRVDIPPDEITMIDGFVLPTLVRTAYDMIRFSARDEVGVVLLDCFLHELNPTPLRRDSLADLVDAHPRCRGNPRVRHAIEWSSARTRSPAESKVRYRWLRAFGVPKHLLLANATLRAGSVTAELDLVDLTSGIVMEYDGPHHADNVQRARDARKNEMVHDAGLTMLRVNSPDLNSERAAIARWSRRRDRAKQDGGALRAERLVSAGVLAELPLRKYSRA